MFVVDYRQQLFDHRKILIMVKNIEPPCESNVFEDLYGSICNYHTILFPKLTAPSAFLRRACRLPQDALMDTQSEVCFSNTSDEHPVWVRYVRQFHSANNAWSSFQSHRLVLGLVGFSLCKTSDDLLLAIENYTKQKALISENYASGRLIILIPTQLDETGLTMEEANDLIAAETDKFPQSLLLTAGEILAHPAEQVFNTDIMGLTDLSPDSASGPAWPRKPGSNVAVQPPILNSRIVGAVTELVSNICSALEKSVFLVAGTNKKSHAANATSTTGTSDQSDGEGSESNFKVLVAPGESASSRLSEDSSTADDQKLSSKHSLGYTPTDPTGPVLQNEASFNFLNVVKHRRSTGRWKKHLGDVLLQLGDLDKAQQHYDATIQLLRPIMDNLWVAGALEGLCAVAVVRKALRTQYSDLYLRSRRPMAIRYPALNRGRSDASEASGLDLATQKQKPLPQYTALDYRNMATEALECYRKSQVDRYMLEETTYKIARFFVSENQKSKACELLDYLFSSTLQDDSDENALRPKRLTTLIELYRLMGYNRRAGFVAWHALDQNLKSVNEPDFDSLFHSARLQKIPAYFGPDSLATMDSPDSLLPTDYNLGSASSANGSILHRPAFPNAVCPVMIHRIMVWYPGLSSGTGLSRFSPRNKSAMLAGSSSRGAVQFNHSKRFWSRNQHNHSLSMLADNVCFLPTGWASLQAFILFRLIQQFKLDVQFEDIIDLPWDTALKFVGFIFSLLDFWPQTLNEAKCVTCMEDLCRLAVMRCSDQPAVASSMPCFTNYASGNADRRQWSRQSNTLTNHIPNPMTFARERTVKLPHTTQLRQLIDLVEIPVHQLPLVQAIHLLPLAPYLAPCELSKEGAVSAVPLQRCVRKTSDTRESEISVATITMLETKAHTGPFFYAPIAQNASPESRIESIDWVSEEPVCVELMVENPLPVDLRISEVCIELTPLSIGEVSKPQSSMRSSSDYGSSMNMKNQTTVQLEAVRLVMELPPVTRSRRSSDRLSGRKRSSVSKPQVHHSFSVALNEACLLETAEDYVRYPRTTHRPAWRRRDNSLSCSIPANRTGIRLVFTFIPMAEMFAIEPGANEPTSKPLFRLTALTYRLVDFGGMHVCLRPSTTGIERPGEPTVNESQEFPLSNRERRVSNSSSSPTSGISFLRSSLTSGIESLLPTPQTPNPLSTAAMLESSTAKMEHNPSIILTNRLFTTLPAIRLLPAMPRLSLYPGVVRSAFTLEEAAEFLPEFTIPSLGKQSTDMQSREFLSIQSPRFRVPQSTQWSHRVAAVVEVSLYPHELRWMPLQMFVRDEAYLPLVEASSNVRSLNVIRVSFWPTETTKDLFKTLQLTADDFVQCIGMDAIHKKLPLEIRNEAITNSHLPNINSENETTLEPICATECGLIWLGFRSERFWQRLSLLLTIPEMKEQLGPGLNLSNSKKVSIEFEIEYALNVPTGTSTESCSMFNPVWARRVRLGVQLNLLSSKHAPLILHNPQIMFLDEPFEVGVSANTEGDSDVDEVDGYHDVDSKSFFYCTLHARMSQSLVPRPVRFTGLQYYVDLELRITWLDRMSHGYREPVRLSTPWTVLAESTPRQRETSVSSPYSPQPGFFRSDSVMSTSSNVTDTFNLIEQLDEAIKEDKLYHCVALPLNALSDAVVRGNSIKLVDPTHLRTDEVGLPLPTNTAWLVHAIESNIGIVWKSHLHGRMLASEQRRLMSSDNPTDRPGVVLPHPDFYRFGRLLLSGHIPEPIVPEKRGPLEVAIPKPPAQSNLWYGNSLSTPGAIAGLLWCHNIRLEVSLSEFSSLNHKETKGYLSPGKQPPQGRLCVRCRDEGTTTYRRKSVFGRRVSQPLMSSQVGSPNTTTPGLNAVMEEPEVSDVTTLETLRRASVPEFVSPQFIRGLKEDLLQGAQRLCTLPFEPVSILIKGWVHQHPLHGARIHNPAQTDPLCSPCFVPPAFDIHRIWTGPVVYEIIGKSSLDKQSGDNESSELSGPLIQGKEFEFIGRAGGEIGLTLRSQLQNQQLQPHLSSIVFFRPGRFWICGLMGIVPESLQLPSVKATDLVTFALPSVSNVETIRFSPTGIVIHVLNDANQADEGYGSIAS